MATISQQLRLVLEKRSDALSVSDFLVQFDQFCIECRSSKPLLSRFEEELQTIYQDLDLSSLREMQIVLSVLHRLSAVLSSTSIISTWWNLTVRPALREPKLPTGAVNHAKELVQMAMQKVDEKYP